MRANGLQKGFKRLLCCVKLLLESLEGRICAESQPEFKKLLFCTETRSIIRGSSSTFA
jgi:hypothetical protein